MNNLATNVSIHDNRISALQAKTQSLVERVDRHLPPLGSGLSFGPAAETQPLPVALETPEGMQTDEPPLPAPMGPWALALGHGQID